MIKLQFHIGVQATAPFKILHQLWRDQRPFRISFENLDPRLKAVNSNVASSVGKRSSSMSVATNFHNGRWRQARRGYMQEAPVPLTKFDLSIS